MDRILEYLSRDLDQAHKGNLLGLLVYRWLPVLEYVLDIMSRNLCSPVIALMAQMLNWRFSSGASCSTISTITIFHPRFRRVLYQQTFGSSPTYEVCYKSIYDSLSDYNVSGLPGIYRQGNVVPGCIHKCTRRRFAGFPR